MTATTHKNIAPKYNAGHVIEQLQRSMDAAQARDAGEVAEATVRLEAGLAVIFAREAGFSGRLLDMVQDVATRAEDGIVLSDVAVEALVAGHDD